jgi:predicted metalloprotease
MRGAGGLGLGGLLILLLLSWFTGVDFLSLFSGGTAPSAPSGSVGTTGEIETTPEEERLVDFVDAVMRDAQGTWAQLVEGYEPTRAVLFRDAIQSTCGFAQSATGPFYCPGDRKVYLDLGFFNELQNRLGARGDFAEAYVLAHELGHHVQNLTGIERRVRGEQQQQPSQVNALSVKMELQADCFAGVWGHTASQSGRAERGLVELDSGDAEEGLNAAASIGDDRLTQGRVAPDRFTHGTSAQRVSWFRRGLETGDPKACNTFQ